MEIFNITTPTYLPHHPGYITALLKQQEHRGIGYVYSGSAFPKDIFEAVEKRLLYLADLHKVDLSTQVIINTEVTSKGLLKGYSFIMIINPFAYCLLLGLDTGGQERENPVVVENIEKQVLEKYPPIPPPTRKGKKKKSSKSILENMKIKEEERQRDMDAMFENLFFKMETKDRYLPADVLTYQWKPEDKMRLGEIERTKWRIVENLGKLTFVFPSESIIKKDEYSSYYYLFCRNNAGLDEEFFEGIFRPFQIVNVQCIKYESMIEFKETKDAIAAFMICKGFKLEGHIFEFSFPKEQECKKFNCEFKGEKKMVRWKK